MVNENDKQEITRKLYCCKICEQSFESKQQIKQHIKEAHPERSKEREKKKLNKLNKDDDSSSKASTSVYSEPELAPQQIKMPESAVIDPVREQFLSERNDNSTTNSVRGNDYENEIKYHCQICNRKFISLIGLNAHKLKHSNLKTEEKSKIAISNPVIIEPNQIISKRESEKSPVCTEERKSPFKKPFLGFCCSNCGQIFKTQPEYELHMNSHKLEKQKISNQSQLINSKVSPTPIPQKQSASPTPIVKVQVGRQSSRRIEAQKLKLKSPIKEKENLTNEKERLHQCPDCKNFYRTPEYVRYHHRVQHTNERPYNCRNCSMKFAWESDLNKHSFRCKGKTKQKQSSRSAAAKNILEKAKKGKPQPNMSNVNNTKSKSTIKRSNNKIGRSLGGVQIQDFSQLDLNFLLEAHSKSHAAHANNDENMEMEVDQENNEEMDHSHLNGFNSKNILDWIKNFRVQSDEDSPGGSFFQCPLCPSKISGQSSFRYHINSHFQINPFPCNICNEKFRSNYNLKLHQKSKHGIAT